MNYKDTVQNIRNQARDIARLKAVSKKMADRADIRKCKDYWLDTIKDTNKSIAICDYNIAKLDKAHPDYDNLLKEQEDLKKTYSDRVDNLTKDVADKDKALNDIAADIDKIESGETKITLEHLNATVADIIANLPKTVADSITFEADGEDN